MAPDSIDSPRALRDAMGGEQNMDVLRALIARATTAVLVADRFGRYVAANDAACRLTGYTEKELLRKAVPDLTGAVDEEVNEVLWRGFLEHGAQTGEFAIKRRDGTTVLVHYEAVTHILPGVHVTFLTPA